MLLEGKKIMVTGCSRGIGRAVAERCLEEGADVYGVARKAGDFGEELSRKAGELNRDFRFFAADVGNEEEIGKTTEEIIKVSGGLDGLVNNAGITRDGLFFAMKREAWDDVLRINLSGVFYISKIVARHMAKRQGGSIVNISSVVGITGNGGQCNYAASKAGVIGLSKSLAKEIASRNVRVNVVAPGFIETDMTSQLKDRQMEAVLQNIPLKRVGHAAEVADSVVFLCSHLASYITGHTFKVDGGLAI